jgi:mevalonate pyrophosphate decarboxylase
MTDVECQKIKKEAHRLVDRFDVSATWDDLMYEIYARQPTEAGLADSAAGSTVSVDQVREQFGLPRSFNSVADEPRTDLRATFALIPIA